MGKRNRNMSGVARFLKTPGESLPSISLQHDSIQPQRTAPPAKKSKIISLGSDWEKYDATSLVPRYTSAEDVPERLQKYYAQRYRYFSLYDEGCLLDDEGWYSITPEKVADQIAERCRCDTILDAFCGVGGNAIAFAKTCHRVIALDISPVRLALARHNAIIYGVQDRIEFVLADYLDFARTYAARPPAQRNIDVVFLSPPWGGPSYLTGSPQKEKSETVSLQGDYSLQSILPISGDELFHLTRRVSRNVAYFLPRNVDLGEVSGLLKPDDVGDDGSKLISTQREVEEVVEVEEEYMGGKLKAVTCYFGELVAGQEGIFRA